MKTRHLFVWLMVVVLSAAENIKQINELVSQDILLLPLRDRIIEGCQFLYFKVYCKIY